MHDLKLDSRRTELKTQGEIESALCDGIRRIEQGFMGRGPTNIRAHLIGDLVIIRLAGVLTVAEQHLAQTLPGARGRDLIKQVRSHLFETARPLLEAAIIEATSVNAVSLHHDISTITGEKVIVVTLAEAPRCRVLKKPANWE